MKKLILLFFTLSFTLFVQSQVSKTVNLTTAGTLSTLLTPTELNTVTNLTITGNLNACDFVTMRDNMPLLAVLDISNVTISAYTGALGTAGTTSTTYPANEIPESAFLSPISYDAKITLKNITLPSSVSSIGGGAFFYCTGLTSLIIPNSVTSIGNNAFCLCSGLTGLTIGNSVTSIGYAAFGLCSGLTGSLIIPNSVTSIGSDAFNDCTGLISVTIPNSVTSIGGSAFEFCTGLTSIYSYSTLPLDLSSSTNVFNGLDATTCTLYVPEGSKSAYQTANQWKDFLNIVETANLTALPSITNASISLYPNPTPDYFQVSGIDAYALITMKDLNGKTLFTKQINSCDKIDINYLSKGIYMIEVNTGEGIIIKKIIKN